jgi:hypothetical protein
MTAQLYWIVGPFVLHKLLGERQAVITIILLFALVLLPLLSFFAATGVNG